MIIAVSDVHLAEKAADPKVRADDRKFAEFLDHIAGNQLKKGGDLVLVGDIFDFWRRDYAKVLMETEDIITRLTGFGDKVKIHYVVGNHDYFMLKLKEYLLDRFPFAEVAKQISLSDGVDKYFFTHGYQLEVIGNPYYKSLTAYELFAENLCLAGDDTGNAASELWEAIQTSKTFLSELRRVPKDIRGALQSMMEKPETRLAGSHEARYFVDQLACSKSRCMYLGMNKDEVLIFGHTHRPFNDLQSRVANTGSWNKDSGRGYNYLEIDKGKISPQTWN